MAERSLLTLHYHSGAKKYELEQTIPPGEQMWVNVADLIRNRVADRKGSVLPAEITSGTYDVQDLTPGTDSLLPGGLNTDSTWGNQVRGRSLLCCGFDAVGFFESDDFVTVGETLPTPIEATDQCTDGQVSVNLIYFPTWDSGDSSIAAVTKGQVQGLAPGTTTGQAFGELIYGYENACPFEPQQPLYTVTVPPEIQFQGNTVNDKTQSVVVGQQIALTSVYTPPSGLTVKSRQWTVGGTTVGGFNTGNTSGGSTMPTFTNDATTFYWVTSGTSLNVSFTVTFSDNSTSSASTTFNVAGPTGGNVKTVTGSVGVFAGPVLGFGPTGISLTASATPPSGYSNSFVWVQLIDGDSLALTPSNGNPVLHCNPLTKPNTDTFPGLDTGYPYSNNNPTTDSPSTGLITTYKEITRSFSATMYLLWSSGLSSSIAVPLGTVNWQWNGDATLTNAQNNQWSLKSGSGSNNPPFQSGSSYPSWSSLVDYNSGQQTCN